MSNPVSHALLAPVRWLRGNLFLANYQRSDADYWQQHRWAGQWRPLGRLLMYRSVLIGMRSDATMMLLFTLQATQGWKLKLARLELTIKRNGNINRQMLVVRNLEDKAATVALQDIMIDMGPLEPLERASMGQVLIKLLELRDSEGNDVLGRKKVTLFKPMIEIYNGREFKRLRGKYWNVELIRAEKHRLKNEWYRRLVKPAGQLWRPLRVRRVLYRIVTNEWALSIQYWMRILTTNQPTEEPLKEVPQ